MARDASFAYDKIADPLSESRANSSVDELVVQFADHLAEGDHLLDAGCGSGLPNARYLATRGLHVTGIDVSTNLLDLARRNVPGGNFLVADLMTYASNQTFAGVVAWEGAESFQLARTQVSIGLARVHRFRLRRVRAP